MNKENNNRTYFKETFEEMHAPEGLRRKVKNMTNMETRKAGRSVVKKLAVAAALTAVVFAGSNGVAYAMTGSTWVESVVAKLIVNGVEQDVELQGEVLEDGTVQYSTTLDVQEGDEVQLSLVTDAENVNPDYVLNVDSAGEPGRTEIVEENDRIYFIDGDVKLDITEDMADGQAFGNYEKDGMVYEYEVKEQAGVPGCYELHITSEEQ